MSDPTPTPETLIAQWRAESKKLLATKETSQNVQFFQEAHGAGFRLDLCADQLEAALQSTPPALTRAQAEAKLTDTALEPFTDDAIAANEGFAWVRQRILDTLFPPAPETPRPPVPRSRCAVCGDPYGYCRPEQCHDQQERRG